MKTIDEVKIFAQGYRLGTLSQTTDVVRETDEWVTWGGYDLHFMGSNWSDIMPTDLLLLVYIENQTHDVAQKDMVYKIVLKG